VGEWKDIPSLKTRFSTPYYQKATGYPKFTWKMAVKTVRVEGHETKRK